jgi:phospholipid/cholesterol/gamma-HCH transport system permease protein
MPRDGAVRALGRRVLAPAAHAAGSLALFLAAVRTAGALRRWPVRQVFWRQVYFTAVQALPQTALIGVLLGLVVHTQIASLAGANAALAGRALVWTVVREIGPLFAAILVISRSSSAVAAEFGTMQINREMDHLRAMGIDPIGYLVVPRVAGMTTAVVSLTVFFEAATILGGLLVSTLLVRAPLLVQLRTVAGALDAFDLSVSLAKCLLFGLIVSASACYHGAQVRASITEVPQATTRAVMQSLTLVVLVNGLVTLASFV